ncbi:MAG TPA: RodZ domain-containing protein [Methylophilaceae bacterium]|nr:RodZ domain-containing protein [Methylophilaceae bacterium]
MSDTVDETLNPADNNRQEPAAPPPLLGVLLFEAREHHGLSIEDVSGRLRLSPRQVKALESDDFSALPEPMITRGFIRNYARLLEIDPEPLLEAYKVHVPSATPRAISIPSANIPISGGDKRPWLFYIFASLVLALLAGAWILYDDYFPQQAKPQAIVAGPEAKNESTAVGEPLPIPALPAAERAAEQEAAAQAATPGIPTAPNAQAAAPTAAASAITDANKPVRASAKLKLSFHEASWVRVIDGSNKEVLNKTKPAGSEELIEGQPPFKVTIGNVAGSKLVFNDKPIDLAAYDKLNVARLTLE